MQLRPCRRLSPTNSTILRHRYLKALVRKLKARRVFDSTHRICCCCCCCCCCRDAGCRCPVTPAAVTRPIRRPQSGIPAFGSLRDATGRRQRRNDVDADSYGDEQKPAGRRINKFDPNGKQTASGACTTEHCRLGCCRGVEP
jgi:hypothetical protein